MILKFLASFFSIILVTATANPVHQFPKQRYQCQFQNVYSNPTASNNIQPYGQDYMVQNASPYKATQTSFNNQMNQLLMEALMTKPSLQGILNSNTVDYRLNGFGNQLMNVPNYNAPPNQPSVVNNYIILPPDCGKVNETRKTENQKHGQVKPGNRKRKTNPSYKARKPRTDSNMQIDSNDIKSAQRSQETKQIRKPKQRKQDGRKRKANVKDDTESFKSNVNEKGGKAEVEESKPQTITIHDEFPKEETVTEVATDPPKAMDIVDNNDQPNSETQTKVRKRKRKRKSKESQSITNHTSIISTQDRHSTDTVKDKRKKTEEYQNREVQETVNNSLHKTAIRQNVKSDSKEKKSKAKPVPKPELPNFMSYMDGYFNNQQFGGNDLFKNYPFNFDQFYPINKDADVNYTKKNKDRRRKTHRKRKKQKAKSISEDDVEIRSKAAEEIDITTPEPKKDDINENLQENIELTSNEITTESADRITDITTEMVQMIDYNEDDEDMTSPVTKNTTYNLWGDLFSVEDGNTVSLDEIYDYYPDFTDSAAHFAYNNEHYARNPFNNRYYYSDKSIEDGFSRARKMHENLHKKTKYLPLWRDSKIFVNEPKNSDRKGIKYYKDSIEVTTSRTHIGNTPQSTESSTENEIQFRTPPTLEFPDFETKKISKDSIRRKSLDPSYKFEDPGEKSSFYSDLKTPMYNGMVKPSKKSDIETVFGHSKVVKYGQVPSNDEEISPRTSKFNEEDTEGATAVEKPIIVFAKSLDYPEY